ncbi:MT-A70 family methyltransferase [Aeromonas salmonicida]|uniref:MT-A70 family methyltransferase n=1 Tax=Aeromonas salmonicida TaxID=645 RepID=UPI0023303A35|nr:MT-A70 family methyltransferase [Aeromonas salmonicida]WCH25198.1 MT-A70 family methyltransferase [Aeromonas salmonicida]
MFQLFHADPPWRYSDKSKNRGGAVRHYETMKLADMKAMNVAELAAPTAVLWMWTTGPQLPDSLELMKAWGFTYRTLGFVWVKRTSQHWRNVAFRLRKTLTNQLSALLGVTPRSVSKTPVLAGQLLGRITPELVEQMCKDFWHWGQGHYTRSNAEIVIVGVRGKGRVLERLDKGVHQVLESLVQEHSVKPDEVYQRLERLYGADVKRLDMFTRRNRPGWSALGDQVDRTDYHIDPDTKQILPRAGDANTQSYNEKAMQP